MSIGAVPVLCIDHEGGHGGSSRSLYSALAHIDRKRIAPHVLGRRSGSIERMYAAQNIPCLIEPKLPAFSAQPRLFDSVVEYARFIKRRQGARTVLHAVARHVEQGFGLVHFNHEGLWWLALWLRRNTRARITMHVRTRPIPNAFSRWQARMIMRVVDRIVFITDNERDHFALLAGRAPGDVIYNCVPPPAPPVEPYPDNSVEYSLRVASLSNYSWPRGVDRLIDVAAQLVHEGRRDIVFLVAGDMHLTSRLPGKLGEIGARGGTLADYASARGVSDLFRFVGHVSEPERVLASCDVVAKLTREENPWGRDVIEAMHFAKPVLTIGRWNQFVRDGETGVLHQSFAADRIASELRWLADNPVERKRMGRAGEVRIRRVCNGRDRADELATLWEGISKLGPVGPDNTVLDSRQPEYFVPQETRGSAEASK